MLASVGLPGVHPVGDLLCLARSREDGALVGTQHDGQWQVIGENQFRRILNAPQSTLTMIITTTGNTCKLDVKYALKPGFTEYKFPRITDRSWAFFTEPNITATRWTIRD